MGSRQNLSRIPTMNDEWNKEMENREKEKCNKEKMYYILYLEWNTNLDLFPYTFFFCRRSVETWSLFE